MHRLIFFATDETANDFFNFIVEEIPVSYIDEPYREIRTRYHEMLLEIGITPADMQTIILAGEPRIWGTHDVTKAGLR